MAPDQTPWRDGIETKEAEKQRGKLYQCSVRPSDQKMAGGSSVFTGLLFRPDRDVAVFSPSQFFNARAQPFLSVP